MLQDIIPHHLNVLSFVVISQKLRDLCCTALAHHAMFMQNVLSKASVDVQNLNNISNTLDVNPIVSLDHR